MTPEQARTALQATGLCGAISEDEEKVCTMLPHEGKHAWDPERRATTGPECMRDDVRQVSVPHLERAFVAT